MGDTVKLREERDITVAMRDGTKLAVDVYRPPSPGKYPVLYASALHNKDIQGPDIADILPPAAGACTAVVRPHRGRRHAPVHRQRLCARHRAAARLGEVGRPLWSTKTPTTTT